MDRFSDRIESVILLFLNPFDCNIDDFLKEKLLMSFQIFKQFPFCMTSMFATTYVCEKNEVCEIGISYEVDG